MSGKGSPLHVFAGQWKDGHMDSYGIKYEYKKHRVLYNGEWRKGKMHGKGTHTYRNGEIYEGEWAEGKRHGKGIYTYANIEYSDGRVFEGILENGRSMGLGIMTHKD